MDPKGKFVYELSQIADSDLDGIFEYTKHEFGFGQAVDYLSQMDELFLKLTAYPEVGRRRDELKKGLRSIRIGSHVVFYRILKNKIRIVRVLHARRDFPRYF
jgi:toxin ParE1/3/4